MARERLSAGTILPSGTSLGRWYRQAPKPLYAMPNGDFGSNLQAFGGYQEENHGFVLQGANLLQRLTIYKLRFCMIF
jgi:hypothetical protein